MIQTMGPKNNMDPSTVTPSNPTYNI